MPIFAHKFFTLSLLLLSVGNSYALQARCGFNLELPPNVIFDKNKDADPLLCSYLEKSPVAIPFVNSITLLSWTDLSKLKVNERPLQNIGFFKLSANSSVKYLGRPSYQDSKNGYFQKTIKKQTSDSIFENNKKTSVITEVKVRWLKPTEDNNQDEVNEIYTCSDVSVSNLKSVVILNWCELKAGKSVSNVLKIIDSLQLK